jgi:DNA processing protein
MEENDVYRIALGMISGIGGITARKILSHIGEPKAVFSVPRKTLMAIPGVGDLLADRIKSPGIVDKAKRELEFIDKKGIKCLFYGEDAYPERLLECHDAPMLLYMMGQPCLNGSRIISIVGTRRPGSYGLDLCKGLVKDLASLEPDLVVISGLAMGLQTVAVLGHGLKYMYPALHRQVAGRITQQGALVTDFPSDQKPERSNFIRRNRIIAGLSDATIVVQSGLKGGALITADIANSYHRDVFAFPGRVGDPTSAGCHKLIKLHEAALIEGAGDVAYLLGWDAFMPAGMEEQGQACRKLSEKEMRIIELLRSEGQLTIDRLSLNCDIPVSRISEILLSLELQGLIRGLPGEVYCTA